MTQTTRTTLLASGALLCLALSTNAYAQTCCPTGGGNHIATQGLGESMPAATDLSTNPAVSIYQFERGGVTYLQINDATGQVRAAVARIENTAWVTPMGKDVDRVSIVDTLDQSRGTVLYDARYFTVQKSSTASGDAWTVTIKK